MNLLELWPFALVLLAFWLLLIRPANKRRAAQAALVDSLAPGKQIMTTAGLFGIVRSVEPTRMSLEIAPGVVVEMVPQAVGRVIEFEDDPGPDLGPQDPAADQGEGPRG